MTNESRSPAEIERDIERERAGLTETLDELQDRFSFEGMTRQITDQFREHGGEFGRSLSDSVKRNPAALALTGIGLAWLIFGNRSETASVSTERRYPTPLKSSRYANDGRDGSDYDRPEAYDNPASRYRDNRMSSTQAVGARPYYSGVTRSTADVPSWARTIDENDGYDDYDDTPGIGDRVGNAASSTRDAVGGAVSTVGATASSAGSSVSKGARAAGSSVSDGAHAVGDAARRAGSAASGGMSSASNSVRRAGGSMAQAGRDAGHSIADSAARLRDRLAEGTEHLGEEARIRVIAARERAIEARRSAMAYTREGRERAVDMFEEQPLIAGAIAVAVGAAIGAAIPRSRTEDRYFGAYSDDLMDEAEHIFAQETEKLGKVATAAKDEAVKVAREAREEGESVLDSAVDKAKESGQRVTDAAKKEADKQNVGDIKS